MQVFVAGSASASLPRGVSYYSPDPNSKPIKEWMQFRSRRFGAVDNGDSTTQAQLNAATSVLEQYDHPYGYLFCGGCQLCQLHACILQLSLYLRDIRRIGIGR